jgi:hypothetical protein
MGMLEIVISLRRKLLVTSSHLKSEFALRRNSVWPKY